MWLTRDRTAKERKYDKKNTIELHEIARHGLHVSEVIDVSLHTLTAMQSYQEEIHGTMTEELDEAYRREVHEYTKLLVQTLTNLKLRSQSNDRRISNEIALVNTHPLIDLYDPLQMLTRPSRSTLSLIRITQR